MAGNSETTGPGPTELSDDDLFRDLSQLHDTRHATLRHGSDDALCAHTERMQSLEQEYLRRRPEREVDPSRLRDGRKAGQGWLDGRSLARTQGAFYAITGMWPLVHMRSVERLLGRKKEHWLVHTVSALLIANALSLLRTGTAPAEIAAARRTGLGAAAALALIDIRHAAPGRISRMYLADALIETAWIYAWTRLPVGERRV